MNCVYTSVVLNAKKQKLVIVETKMKEKPFLRRAVGKKYENNGFIGYNQSIFTWEDQGRIANLLEHINNIGAYFIMTNAAHESIDNLFHQFGTRHIVQRHSLIGGNGATREKVNEYIYTNI